MRREVRYGAKKWQVDTSVCCLVYQSGNLCKRIFGRYGDKILDLLSLDAYNLLDSVGTLSLDTHTPVMRAVQ